MSEDFFPRFLPERFRWEAVASTIDSAPESLTELDLSDGAATVLDRPAYEPSYPVMRRLAASEGVSLNQLAATLLARGLAER